MLKGFAQADGGETLMGQTVLVVDDSAVDRTRLQQILQDVGYRVLLAESGQQALALARSEQPDLILMDVAMPELDGFATTRRLKTEAETRHIPVVFVTGRHLKADMAWGYILGAHGYVTKPYTVEQILAQVEEVTR
jgi:twitching motility two-component system response regulator PilH